MNFDQIKRVHLIGICGTAMASLAGLLKEKGFAVSGSDSNVYPPMSLQLEELQISIYAGYSSENLRRSAPDLVIPGNAIPRGNVELEEMLRLRLPYLSMAEAIKEFFLRGTKPVVVAGTHGKTTTASMVAWLLEVSGLTPSLLVGGVPKNFGRSFRFAPNSKYIVIEGDEYDTGFMDKRPKFVQYLPEFVILNPVEYDHADLYPDMASVENAFWQLIKVVPSDAPIIVNRDSEPALRLAQKGYSKVITFGFDLESDFRITGERWENGIGLFQINGEKFRLRMFGKHNLANVCASVALGKYFGLSDDKIHEALDTFQGVKRRMELRGEEAGVAVYDDFAHHPTAIAATLEGARLAFGSNRIWAIFEPRSWSCRRNVFQQEFGRAFHQADFAVIASVFEQNKILPEMRLDPEKLALDISKSNTEAYYLPDESEILRIVLQKARPGDKLVLMSNGSFNGLHDKILHALKGKDL
jgi:UDP-N-acetylmuramate: L-alanyl-gamma-D-glutamyl-meso-diaminopimelate ligase